MNRKTRVAIRKSIKVEMTCWVVVFLLYIFSKRNKGDVLKILNVSIMTENVNEKTLLEMSVENL